jgi:dihydroorotate dehydrogenase (fumarate)
MTLERRIGRLKLEHPLMNAAGECKKLEQVMDLSRSATAAIVMGSITPLPRLGNEGETYHRDEGYALNSRGLPNPGIPAYERDIPKMSEVANAHDKPLVVSIAGFSFRDYDLMAELMVRTQIQTVEVNLGCPNVWDDGKQKRIPCFDPDATCAILKSVDKILGDKCNIWVKVSPFSDPALLAEVASAISGCKADSAMSGYGGITAVVTSNTFPNAFAIDRNNAPRITNGIGLAGMSGEAMKPIGLGQVVQFRQALPESISVIGVGGITSGRDIHDYLISGATAVQIGTHYFDHGPSVFSSLLEEYLEL